MPFRLTNRAKHLLIVPLNSGESVHLAPGETSEAIEDYELQRNDKVDKLLTMNLISSEAADDPANAGVTEPIALLPASTATTEQQRRTTARTGNRRT